MEQVLQQFCLDGTPVSCEPLGNGHINRTFRVMCSSGKAYTLQRINRVALTESGKNIMRDAMHRMDTLDEIMQEGLTNEEQKILCRCLSKMRENLSRYINSREADAHD